MKHQRKKTKEIDLQLQKEKMSMDMAIKLLLLGKESYNFSSSQVFKFLLEIHSVI